VVNIPGIKPGGVIPDCPGKAGKVGIGAVGGICGSKQGTVFRGFDSMETVSLLSHTFTELVFLDIGSE
jgi:hypothetical protein